MKNDTERVDRVFFKIQFDAPVIDISVRDSIVVYRVLKLTSYLFSSLMATTTQTLLIPTMHLMTQTPIIPQP